MFGPADNRITLDDRARAYEILGFGGRDTACSVPESLNLAILVDATRLRLGLIYYAGHVATLTLQHD